MLVLVVVAVLVMVVLPLPKEAPANYRGSYLQTTQRGETRKATLISNLEFDCCGLSARAIKLNPGLLIFKFTWYGCMWSQTNININISCWGYGTLLGLSVYVRLRTILTHSLLATTRFMPGCVVAHRPAPSKCKVRVKNNF
ncbi:uncharacterized protein LOC141535620 [Cotesia typhae]|uniref:uncharacterized protein LOC141535620 n=1 Tax=Cotesia typhae TaxID=2053667 RepID=UPI003D697B39